jgi:fluoroacetyl-CoA thioesterase
MLPSLRAGLEHSFRYRVPAEKTVPHLYREAPEFQQMPEVFATGFLVGLVEWTCIQLVNPHLDWPREQTVGTRVELSHDAPTPPGFEVGVRVRLAEVDGRRLVFDVSASDGPDAICAGRHERMVIDAGRFAARLAKKREASHPSA